MNNELIDRYIYAVTKHLPLKNREDIKEELLGLISDMLDERCRELPPSDKDVRVVLAELGTPNELAEKYSPDKSACLIGAPYFTQYKTIIKIVTICAAVGLTIACTLANITSGEDVRWFLPIFDWLATVINAELSCFAIVTIIFAIFQRKGIKLDESGLDNLPAVPKENKNLSKFDSIATIVISAIFGTVFLAVPQIFSAIFTFSEGEIQAVPIFDTAAVRGAWSAILGCAIIGIAKGCFQLYEKKYTRRLMIVTIVANALSMIFTFFLLCNHRIMNWEFVNYVQQIFRVEYLYDNTPMIIRHLTENFNLLFMYIILFFIILDTALVIYRTLKYAKKQDSVRIK